jgi:probable F420-dependent oxidoreductase
MTSATFGLFLPTGDWDEAVQSAQWAEASGFHSVSLNDHFVSQDGGREAPQLECLSTLAAIAAVTETVRLVPTVIAAAYRSPAMLAKATATIDRISHGRFVLGIGSGWNVAEYEAHGYEFPDAAERLDRLEETIEVVKAMWTADDPVHDGTYFRVEHASSQPRPVQRPHPPVMVGGSSTHLLRIAARHADLVNLIPPTHHGKDFIKDPQGTVRFDRPRLRRRIELLRDLAEAEGRRPDEIELTGFVLANVSEDPSHPTFDRLAGYLGFDDLAAAKQSPVALIGTPAEVVDELHDRVETDGITHFVVVSTSHQTRDLLAEEVLPAFAASTLGR